MKIILSIIILTLVTACGGGGGGGGGGDDGGGGGGDDFWGDWDDQVTPEPTPEPIENSYSLAVLSGAGDVGIIYDFKITGFMSEVGDLTGYATFLKRKSSVVNGILTFQMENILEITPIETNDTATLTIISYVDEFGYMQDQTHDDTPCVVPYNYKLPDTVSVYDSDNFPDLQCGDYILRGNWKIQKAENGNIHYIESRQFIDSSGYIAGSDITTLTINQKGIIVAYKNVLESKEPYYTMTVESI